MDVREISLYIARSPEKVIKEIGERDCILNNPVKPCPDLKELEPFVIHHYWSNSESVNVFLVVGSSSLDCDGRVSWIDLLKYGKKASLNLRLLAENPDYYFETRKKEPVMHYIRVNDEIFVGRDGNYRTAIAKVLFYYTGHTVIHGIEFEEYKIDFELKKKFEYLKELLFRKATHVEAKVLRKHVKREDTPSWEKDYYEISVLLVNHRKNRKVEVKPEELDKVLKKVESLNWWRRVFRRGSLEVF